MPEKISEQKEIGKLNVSRTNFIGIDFMPRIQSSSVNKKLKI
mgnify:CR=1 FL=1